MPLVLFELPEIDRTRDHEEQDDNDADDRPDRLFLRLLGSGRHAPIIRSHRESYFTSQAGSIELRFVVFFVPPGAFFDDFDRFRNVQKLSDHSRARLF